MRFTNLSFAIKTALDRHQQTPLTPYPQQAYRKKAFEVTRHNGALPSCRSALVKTLAEIA